MDTSRIHEARGEEKNIGPSQHQAARASPSWSSKGTSLRSCHEQLSAGGSGIFGAPGQGARPTPQGRHSPWEVYGNIPKVQQVLSFAVRS